MDPARSRVLAVSELTHPLSYSDQDPHWQCIDKMNSRHRDTQASNAVLCQGKPETDDHRVGETVWTKMWDLASAPTGSAARHT